MTPSNCEIRSVVVANCTTPCHSHGAAPCEPCMVEYVTRALDAAVADATAELRAALATAATALKGALYWAEQEVVELKHSERFDHDIEAARDADAMLDALAARAPDGDAK